MGRRYYNLQVARLRLLLGLRALRQGVADEVEHVLDDLLGRRDVPERERALRAVADGGREDRVARDREVDGRVLLLALREERDGERGVEAHALGCAGGGALRGEEEERAEHVLVRLVVAGAEDELGVGVEVEDALHDLALVHRERAHFEVLLADEDCMWKSAYTHENREVSQGCAPSIGRLRARLFSSRSWHWWHWKRLGPRAHQHPTYLQLHP